MHIGRHVNPMSEAWRMVLVKGMHGLTLIVKVATQQVLQPPGPAGLGWVAIPVSSAIASFSLSCSSLMQRCNCLDLRVSSCCKPLACCTWLGRKVSDPHVSSTRCRVILLVCNNALRPLKLRCCSTPSCARGGKSSNRLFSGCEGPLRAI